MGDHSSHSPRTDFGLVAESSPLTTLQGPLKLRLFGEIYLYVFFCGSHLTAICVTMLSWRHSHLDLHVVARGGNSTLGPKMGTPKVPLQRGNKTKPLY